MQQEQDTIGVLFGIITYLRCFFSEDSFEDTSYDKLKLKKLKSTAETTKLMEWINSIKTHQDRVHKVIFGVYRKSSKSKRHANECATQEFEDKKAFSSKLVQVREKNDELVELYSISFDKRIDIKGICKAIQNLKLLKGRFSLKLKVYTNSYVEIKGFKRTDEIWDVGNLKLNDLDGFKIFIKEHNSNEYKDEQVLEQNIVNNYVSGSKKLGIDEVETSKEKEDSKNNVICCCTINIDDCCVIQCSQCKNYVHCCCHGFFSTKDKRIREDFKCYCCIGGLNVNVRNCSLYRRCLFLLYNSSLEHFSSKQYFLSFLKDKNYISTSLANHLFLKLKEDGFFKKNANSFELVMNKEIKEKIKDYFNGKKTECLISISDIACNVE